MTIAAGTLALPKLGLRLISGEPTKADYGQLGLAAKDCLGFFRVARPLALLFPSLSLSTAFSLGRRNTADAN